MESSNVGQGQTGTQSDKEKILGDKSLCIIY